MNIVFSAKVFLPQIGGTINYASMLARAFHDAGHEVTIVTRSEGEPQTLGEVPILRNPTWREKMNLAKRADILIQVESSWQDALPFLLKGVPWFPTIHRGYSPVPFKNIKPWIMLQLERVAFKLGRTIGVSEYALRSWGIKGACIGSSYEDGLFFLPPEGAERNIDILFIGRMTYDKGALVLLEALRRIFSTHPGLVKRVYFAGTGPALEELKAGCESLREHAELKALGAVGTSDELADYLRHSKILAFPTTSKWLEASPIVPLEGLASGCVVVASDIGGTKENIGPMGYLVRPDDVDQLAETLTQILKEPPLFDHFAAEKFLANRKVKATADRYLELFQKALHQS